MSELPYLLLSYFYIKLATKACCLQFGLLVFLFIHRAVTSNNTFILDTLVYSARCLLIYLLYYINFYLLNILSKISPYFISLGFWTCHRFKNRLRWRAPWVRITCPICTMSTHLNVALWGAGEVGSINCFSHAFSLSPKHRPHTSTQSSKQNKIKQQYIFNVSKENNTSLLKAIS